MKNSFHKMHDEGCGGSQGRPVVQFDVPENAAPSVVEAPVPAQPLDLEAVRDNLAALLRAIVLDAEAWPTDPPAGFGKLREPVLRFTTMVRAMNVSLTGPFWPIDSLSDDATELGQQPFEPPSVFNFYRPGYVPPQSALGDAGLVSPEMQITNETTAIGWVNYVTRFLRRPPVGTYRRGQPNEFSFQINFGRDDLLAIVETEFIDQSAAEQLVDEITARLCPHGINPAIRTVIVQRLRAIISDRYRPERTDQNAINYRNDIHLDRLVATTMMIAVSPDFLHER